MLAGRDSSFHWRHRVSQAWVGGRRVTPKGKAQRHVSNNPRREPMSLPPYTYEILVNITRHDVATCYRLTLEFYLYVFIIHSHFLFAAISNRYFNLIFTINLFSCVSHFLKVTYCFDTIGVWQPSCILLNNLL